MAKKGGNPQYLIVPTSEQARINGSKGGKASAKSKKDRKSLKLALEILLDKDFIDDELGRVNGAELIAMKQFERAIKGDTKAFETVRDTAGQKPVDKVMIAEVDQDVIDEVESIVNETEKE